MRDSDNSIFGLIRGVRNGVKSLLKEEVQLVKTEMSEKITAYGRNSVAIAVGGFVAYAGLIVFLGGLGFLIAFLFEKLGINPLLADFAGLGVIGFLVIATGAIFILKGMKALSKESFAPQRTVETLQHLKGNTSPHRPKPAPKPKEEKRTSEEIEGAVLAIENRIAQILEELRQRLTFGYFRAKAKSGLITHPLRWGSIALGIGLAGSFLIRRKLRLGRT